MSEIKSAGIKGYVILGVFVSLLLFVILVVYIYKINGQAVPADPDLYGFLAEFPRAALRA